MSRVNRGNVMGIDRVEASRALAKVLAYLACGQRGTAVKWVRVLIDLLGMKGEIS